MDYSKSGTASLSKKNPAGTPVKGAPSVSYGQAPSEKAALLARMKANAAARKAKTQGES